MLSLGYQGRRTSWCNISTLCRRTRSTGAKLQNTAAALLPAVYVSDAPEVDALDVQMRFGVRTGMSRTTVRLSTFLQLR